MSVNWVMLASPTSFTPLPSETTLYTSPPRNSFSLQTLNKYPGREPYHISSSSGTLYLTNRRIIYLPSTPSAQLQSFAAPVLNLHDSHVTAPWIGPNVWTTLVQPVQGGGIPPQHAALELKVTFKEGGAYEFQSRFERVKERLQQAVEVARESGQVAGDGSETGRGRGGGALAGVNVDNVHLDELPAYEARGDSVRIPLATEGQAATTHPDGQVVDHEAADEMVRSATASQVASPQQVFSPPSEPPPGYEEVQREVIEDEVARRLSVAHIERE